MMNDKNKELIRSCIRRIEAIRETDHDLIYMDRVALQMAIFHLNNIRGMSEVKEDDNRQEIPN